MEATKERTPAQQSVPARARAVKKVNDDQRIAERERVKAEKRFDRALEALQALKSFIPAEETEEEEPAPAPVKKAPVVKAKPVKAVKVAPPPQELSEESESEDEVAAPAKITRAKPVPVINMAKRTFVFC